MRLIYCYKNQDRLEHLRIAFTIHSIHEERKLVREFGKHFGIEDTDVPAINEALDEQEVEAFRAACRAGVNWDVLKRDIAIMETSSSSSMHAVPPRDTQFSDMRVMPFTPPA